MCVNVEPEAIPGISRILGKILERVSFPTRESGENGFRFEDKGMTTQLSTQATSATFCLSNRPTPHPAGACQLEPPHLAFSSQPHGDRPI